MSLRQAPSQVDPPAVDDIAAAQELPFLEQHGWVAESWPAKGLTKGKFRQTYGASLDSLSGALGARRRSEERRLKQAELISMVDATHLKLPLHGASMDQMVRGPLGDLATEGRNYWTFEEAYDTMHNEPYLLNEAGHRGQALYTSDSDSRFGADSPTFRHELDHLKLLRKSTRTLQTEVHAQRDQALVRRLRELQQAVAMSYRCREFPSAFHTNAASHYGTGAPGIP